MAKSSLLSNKWAPEGSGDEMTLAMEWERSTLLVIGAFGEASLNPGRAPKRPFEHPVFRDQSPVTFHRISSVAVSPTQTAHLD